MGFAAKTTIGIDGRDEVDSFIEFGNASNLFELAPENKNVGQVDGFADRQRSYIDVDEAKGMKVASSFVFSQLFDSGGYLDLSPLQKTQVVSASDHATHIAFSMAAGSIAEGQGG